MGNPVVHFEIGATDHQARVRFYGELFGWTVPGGAYGGSRVYGPIQEGEGTRTGAFRDLAGNMFGVYRRAAS